MDKLQLVMAIHCHQPVGNFDSVFEQALERSYTPFLETLRRHPAIRVGLHYSGCLLEWIEEHQPAFLDNLADLQQRGQVELLGGGFYEPMLAVLPEDDALAQIAMMRDYLKRRFGAKPEGLWLPERVWEPALASLLSRAHVRYSLVDDAAFFQSGIPPGRLFGYYTTEKAGAALAMFAIDRGLRYAIPFRPVDEVIQDLKGAAGEGSRGLVYGDDGEKFGLWPGTHEWVYARGWLEEFFAAIEKNSEQIETITPGAYLKRFPANGSVYLPTASYGEMGSWALPAEAAGRFMALKKELERTGLWERARPFLHGGLFENFFTKYPEANQLHKKMLLVSRKLREASQDGAPWGEDDEAARRALYRAQCNCTYWHGLFGGLYLPFLRDRAYRELITAENILDARAQGEEDWISFEQRDFDGDLEEEVLVENARISVAIDPAEGGVVTEIDYRPTAFNLTNVLTRRLEGYHLHLQETAREMAALESGGEAENGSGQELFSQMNPDRWTRHSFMDRFPAPGTTLEEIQRGTYHEEGNFLGARYQREHAEIDEKGDCHFEILLVRAGIITRSGRQAPLLLEKRIEVPADQAEIAVLYTLRNTGDEPLDLIFCPELNLNLLAGDDPRRVFEFEGLVGPGPRMKAAGELSEVSWLALADFFQGFRARLELDPPAAVLRHPVETVSQSEEGLARIYQGSAILPKWELTIPPKRTFAASVHVKLLPADEDAVVPLPSPAEPERGDPHRAPGDPSR